MHFAGDSRFISGDDLLIRSDAGVLAIVITFHPEPGTLMALVEELSAQVDEVLVVDNTPAIEDKVWNMLSGAVARCPGLRMVRLGDNRGIATALNVGIDVALNEGFSHVLLSDQDSLPAAGMVAGLLEAEERARASGVNVGAVGPVYRDRVTGIEFPFQVQESGRLFYSSRYATDEKPDIETLCLISSGCMIRTDTLRQIGGMMEGLFIDHVDVEWCHRAVSNGYVLLGSRRAVMKHNMGDLCVHVWFFGWRALNGYGPTRLYYRFRNFVHLLRLPYITPRWKIRAGWYWAGNFYGHAFFGSNRIMNLRAMLAGLRDGVRGIWGVRTVGSDGSKS